MHTHTDTRRCAHAHMHTHVHTHAGSPSSLRRALYTLPHSGCSLLPGGRGPWTPQRRHVCPPAFSWPGPYGSRQPDHGSGLGVAASVWPGAGSRGREAGPLGAGGSAGLRQAVIQGQLPTEASRARGWGAGPAGLGGPDGEAFFVNLDELEARRSSGRSRPGKLEELQRAGSRAGRPAHHGRAQHRHSRHPPPAPQTPHAGWGLRPPAPGQWEAPQQSQASFYVRY